MPPNIPAEVKQAFGHFVIEFSRLEFLVQLVTWSLIEDDLRVGWSTTGGDTFGQMVEHCARLVKLRFPEEVEPFKPILARLKEANGHRNRILHAFWGWNEDAESLHTFRVTRAGVPDLKPSVTSAADLERLGDDVFALSKDFAVLGKKWVGARVKS